MSALDKIQAAKTASAAMAHANTLQKNRALEAIASALEEHAAEIIAANEIDLEGNLWSAPKRH